MTHKWERLLSLGAETQTEVMASGGSCCRGVRKGSLLNKELDLLDEAVGWVRTNQAEGITRAKTLRSNPPLG